MSRGLPAELHREGQVSHSLPKPILCPPPPVARLLISPSAQVVEGQAVTLSCRSGLSPASDTRFSWYLNGALLLQGSSSDLLLPAASSTDAGSYYCVAQTGPSTSGPSPPAVLTVLCEWAWPLPTMWDYPIGTPTATPFHILLTLGPHQRVFIGHSTMDPINLAGSWGRRGRS